MRVLKGLSLSQKGVILLSALTLMLGVANAGRAALALRYAVRLPNLPTTVPLEYLAVMGGFWGAVFIACGAGLSLFREWGRWATLVGVTSYQMNVWVNRLLFSASDYADQTIPRDAGLTVAFLLLFWISLNLPQVRQAFEGDGEQQSGY